MFDDDACLQHQQRSTATGRRSTCRARPTRWSPSVALATAAWRWAGASPPTTAASAAALTSRRTWTTSALDTAHARSTSSHYHNFRCRPTSPAHRTSSTIWKPLTNASRVLCDRRLLQIGLLFIDSSRSSNRPTERYRPRPPSNSLQI